MEIVEIYTKEKKSIPAKKIYTVAPDTVLMNEYYEGTSIRTGTVNSVPCTRIDWNGDTQVFTFYTAETVQSIIERAKEELGGVE